MAADDVEREHGTSHVHGAVDESVLNSLRYPRVFAKNVGRNGTGRDGGPTNGAITKTKIQHTAMGAPSLLIDKSKKNSVRWISVSPLYRTTVLRGKYGASGYRGLPELPPTPPPPPQPPGRLTGESTQYTRGNLHSPAPAFPRTSGARCV